MGFGMLNGILSGLVGLLTEWVSKIIGAILQLIIKLVAVPLLKMLMTLLEYVLGAYFYSVSCFLLNLLDFVQMLFRAFAGLETEGVTLTFTQGGSGFGTTDPLMQIITSSAVKQAFLSMAIVGFFLLIITTIFQMIKVEYTTEGAKNSKTPILQKAFKGACNLILLPLLVIFGIFIGNRILDLLDTATSPGENTRASDLLFTTAASDAFYRHGQFKIILGNTDPLTVTVSVLANSVYIIFDTVSDAINEIFKNYNKEEVEFEFNQNEFVLSESERAAVEAKFMNHSEMTIQEVQHTFVDTKAGEDMYNTFIKENKPLAGISHKCKYDCAVAVTGYYNYAKINYLLLIFSACLLLKAFFFSIFGLMTRLYKCAVLFIISPAVIGMTPINDGGLGKWRTAFIGQVICAYGTVLAVNLFLTLVKLMVSIEITFDNGGLEVWGISAGNGLSSAMMTGIIKSIMIISGAYLIEKFAKDLGGYFGADDAMSAGKEAAKQVGQGAMKAVSVGAAVAGGGMKLMGGALKMGKGVANRLSMGRHGISQTRSGRKAQMDAVNKKKEGINDKYDKNEEEIRGRMNDASGKIAGLDKENNVLSAEKAKLEVDASLHPEDENIQKKINAINGKIESNNNEKAKHKKTVDDGNKVLKDNEDLREKEISKVDDDNKHLYKAVEKDKNTPTAREKFAKFKTGVASRGIMLSGMLQGTTSAYLKKLNPVNKITEEMKKNAKEELAGSDEYKAAEGNVAYNKGKRAADKFEGGVFTGALVNSKNNEAARIFAETAAKQFATESARLENAAKKQSEQYNKWNNMYKSTGDSVYLERMTEIEKWMTDNNVQFNKEASIKAEFSESVKVELQTESIEKALKDAVKNGANKEELAEIIKREMSRLGRQGNDELIQQIIREFEKTIQKFGGK